MTSEPPDYLSYKSGLSTSDSCLLQSNPLLQPLDGSYVQEVLLNFQDTTSYISNDNSKSFVGKNYGMCSMKEYNQKVQMNTANDLERDASKNVNPKLTLNSFQRSDAFRTFKPEDVRPCLWCRRTVYYALSYFVDSDIVKKPYLMDKNFTYLDIYNFLRDRLRSIWQDLTVQRCTKHRAYIECFEISIRFLIYSNELLCENEEYDEAQNMILLNTCLDKLMDGYSDVRSTVSKVTPSESINERIRNDPNFTLIMNVLTYVSNHEPEFWSYRLLMLIPQLLTPGGSATFCDICQRIPKDMKNNSLVRYAISSCIAASSGNVYLYFKLMNSNDCHPLQGALMNRFSGCVRVRFLYNVIVYKMTKDTTNPMIFERLKVLLGYDSEPDKKLLSFLQRYDINRENDDLVKLECANIEQLSHDNNYLSKIPGKTQTISSVLSHKFTSFKHRQLILDPDFRAPFMSPDTISTPTSLSQFGSTTPLLNESPNKVDTTFATPVSQVPFPLTTQTPNLVRTDTFGNTEDTTFNDSKTPGQSIYQPEQSAQTSYVFTLEKDYSTCYHTDVMKLIEESNVKLFKPKLDETLSDLRFSGLKSRDLRRIGKSTNKADKKPVIVGGERKSVSSKRKKQKRVAVGASKGHQDYILDKFGTQKMPTDLELLSKEKNYTYLSLNGSLFYLEHEFNHYLNKTMSKCILYSMYLCNKCKNSRYNYTRLLRPLFRSFKRGRVALLKIINIISQYLKKPRIEINDLRRLNLDSLFDSNQFEDLYYILSSKNFKIQKLKGYFENYIRPFFINRKDKGNDKGVVSIFNPLIFTTYKNIENVVNNTYTRLLSIPGNSGITYNPSVWASGLFVHLSFFDFNTQNRCLFSLQDLGSGLVHFNDNAQGYTYSEYCLNLKMDILSICGLEVSKEDLFYEYGSGQCKKTMFQILSFELPYKNNTMSSNHNLPISLNISLSLKSDYSLARVKSKHSFKYPEFEIDDTIEYHSDVYKFRVRENDLRFSSNPQIALFLSSKTFHLVSDDMIYNIYSNKDNPKLEFEDSLSLVDSISILSFVVNNQHESSGWRDRVTAVVCYRLCVSKLDILTLFKVYKKSDESTTCTHKMKMFSKGMNSLLTEINNSLLLSLIKDTMGFNITRCSELLKRSVRFVCVGFEYQNTRNEIGLNSFSGSSDGSEEIFITRLLYRDGLQRTLNQIWEHHLKEGSVTLLQKAVNMPNLHSFLLDLIKSENFSLSEIELNPHGLLSNAIHKFINLVILNFPERLWMIQNIKYKKKMNGSKRTGNEFVNLDEYSKNNFISMFMSLKEYVKATEHRIELKGKENIKERKKLVEESLSEFISKVLECFRIEKFMIPYSLAFYMLNISQTPESFLNLYFYTIIM